MARLEFHALNISAHPHPVGIYHELFSRVAAARVNYFGEKVAAISKPTEPKGGIFWGYIYTWNEIDHSQPYIDTVLLEAPNEEQLSSINIPENIGFNSQRFYYIFRESDHTLVFESKNEDGRTFAPANAEKVFRFLFGQEILGKISFQLRKPDYVEVDLIIDEEILDKIYSIDYISSIDMLISIPNDDDNEEDTENLIEHLKKIKARSQFLSYKADKSGDGIVPDERLKAEAEAALVHGYVKGNGRDEDGKAVSLSTKSYPRKVSAFVDIESLSFDTALQVAREFISRTR
jgi:hypothetical protein